MSLRSIIELGPRQIAVDVLESNYRKALWFFWRSKVASILFAGLYKTYFYKAFPTAFVVS